MGECRKRHIRVVSRLIVVASLALATLLGSSSTPFVHASIQIASVDATGRVALGDSHTCAITNDNKIWCWGDNSSFQLGVGSGGSVPADSPVPLQTLALGGGRVPQKIAAGSLHTCALATDGTVWCWGHNGNGALGDGTIISKGSPTQVTLAATATSIAAGGSSTCAVLSDNRVQCWGKNTYGQLGINTDGTSESTPQVVAHIPDWFIVSSMEIGANHTCGISTTGAAWCWGYYLDGRLGTTQTSNVVIPAATSALGGTAQSISAGGAHTCVVLTNGALTCFGKNNNGQLSQALATTSNASPAQVSLTDTATFVTAGFDFTCAALTAGGVACFGANGYGQIAMGATSTRQVNASLVTGLVGNVVDVIAGTYHVCAVVSSGELKCWGRNDIGQTGSNSGNLVETSAVAVGTLNVVPTTTTTTTTTTTSTSTTLATTTTSITPPPVYVDAGVSTITSTSVSVVKSGVVIQKLQVKRGAQVSAAKVAQAVGMTIPKTSQGSLRIAIVTGASRCVFVGRAIAARRPGVCTIAVTLLPKKGHSVTRRTSISVR